MQMQASSDGQPPQCQCGEVPFWHRYPALHYGAKTYYKLILERVAQRSDFGEKVKASELCRLVTDLPGSESRVRDLVRELERQGLVAREPGKHGVFITQEGVAFLSQVGQVMS